jgi:hypothetical protein
MPNSENQYSCQKQLNTNEQYPTQNEHTSVNIQGEEYCNKPYSCTYFM